MAYWYRPPRSLAIRRGSGVSLIGETIYRLGGPYTVAQIAGVTVRDVQKWISERHLPVIAWPALMASPAGKDAGLTTVYLTDLNLRAMNERVPGDRSNVVPFRRMPATHVEDEVS